MNLQVELSVFDKRVEHFARCRAYVLQAVTANPGMTYIEIREWIREHKRFIMEDIGRRVRELARDLNPAFVEIRYDGGGHAHVYPKETV